MTADRDRPPGKRDEPLRDRRDWTPIIDAIDNAIANHMGNAHQSIDVCIDELAAAVLGSPRSELEGGGRHTDGLRHAVATNGAAIARIEKNGVRTRVPIAAWLPATITGISGVVVALVALLG